MINSTFSNMSRLFAPLSTTLAIIFMLTGCASKDKEFQETPAKDLYNQAVQKLEAKEYGEAAQLFEETERQHPYSEWATRAQLMSGFAFYQAQKYTEAIGSLDTFLTLHPAHHDAPYALYLKGLCHYEQIATVQRDPEQALLADQSFKQLIRRYPDSKYVRAAKPKIELVNDHIAGKEMEVGRFYLKKRNYIAALGRFKRVVDRYDTTVQTAEALHRLVECYVALGMDAEARKTAAVLGHNFPGSTWYADTYVLLEGQDYRLNKHKEDGRPWYKKMLS